MRIFALHASHLIPPSEDLKEGSDGLFFLKKLAFQLQRGLLQIKRVPSALLWVLM